MMLHKFLRVRSVVLMLAVMLSASGRSSGVDAMTSPITEASMAAQASPTPAVPKVEIPPPLTVEQIQSMATEDAQTALKAAAAALQLAEMDEPTRQRLRDEFRMIHDRLVELQRAPAQPAELPTTDVLIDGDAQRRFVLIGPAPEAAAPPEGWSLLVVFPGGEGSIEFLPFVRRLASSAMPEGTIVAMAVAPRWRDDENRVVWPTRGLPEEKMKFATEDFAEAIVREVASRHRINASHVAALGWSSGGPAVYATLMQEKTAYTGAFVAMSVFKPQQLPPVANAKGRAFYLLHSAQDFIKMRFPEAARAALTKAGAKVTLQTYEGGHGWHGDVHGMIRSGMRWLQEQHSGGTNAEPTSTPPAQP